ncbi:MAG: hypothetical protein J6K88_05120 [Oscillospiraceae bacterium]|nr:hypothetical protein [Oscillospiraceae bacterium]
MKESIIGTIIGGHFIADMTGVGKYTVLRTGAALFKADVPACAIPFEDNENLSYTADFTRLLADRFGPDIIICADGIKNKKMARVAIKSGARAAFSLPDKKIISYLKKKGIAVFADCKTEEDISLSEKLSADAVRVPSNDLKTNLPKIIKADSIDEIPDAFSGDFIPEFASPIITSALLEDENYAKIEKNSTEILKKFN